MRWLLALFLFSGSVMACTSDPDVEVWNTHAGFTVFSARYDPAADKAVLGFTDDGFVTQKAAFLNGTTLATLSTVNVNTNVAKQVLGAFGDHINSRVYALVVPYSSGDGYWAKLEMGAETVATSTTVPDSVLYSVPPIWNGDTESGSNAFCNGAAVPSTQKIFHWLDNSDTATQVDAYLSTITGSGAPSAPSFEVLAKDDSVTTLWGIQRNQQAGAWIRYTGTLDGLGQFNGANDVNGKNGGGTFSHSVPRAGLYYTNAFAPIALQNDGDTIWLSTYKHDTVDNPAVHVWNGASWDTPADINDGNFWALFHDPVSDAVLAITAYSAGSAPLMWIYNASDCNGDPITPFQVTWNDFPDYVGDGYTELIIFGITFFNGTVVITYDAAGGSPDKIYVGMFKIGALCQHGKRQQPHVWVTAH